jgi:epoxyqueuosine reductase
MHGEMGYMERAPEKRADLRSWFPQARSVALAAFSYRIPGEHPPGSGRLAAYARPPDYHDTLKGIMRDAARWCADRWPGTDAKPFVDTSPLLERLYARVAGLGWVGKNTMLLSRSTGSFFLLAGLALDRELAPDRPVTDHCGSCTRCLDACPTDAFPSARVLDASRCIAYFTVEHRNKPIPEEFRRGHGDWLFGCDLCQEVCPWNRFSQPARVFEARLPAALDLEEIAGLSREEFNKRFKGTPLRRTGWASVVRNALLAMGNAGDSRHKPTLERFADHEDSVLAEQARWSLTRIDRIDA